jgi:hypothetical protein
MNAREITASVGLTAQPVGSRVTVSPPPMDTDADYIVYVPSLSRLWEALNDDGWMMGGSTDNQGGDGWSSWRKGEENLIVVTRKPIYDSFMAATEIARILNLKEKGDRVALFQTLEQHWPGAGVGEDFVL